VGPETGFSEPLHSLFLRWYDPLELELSNPEKNLPKLKNDAFPCRKVFHYSKPQCMFSGQAQAELVFSISGCPSCFQVV
jgi:hypothetical protein